VWVFCVMCDKFDGMVVSVVWWWICGVRKTRGFVRSCLRGCGDAVVDVFDVVYVVVCSMCSVMVEGDCGGVALRGGTWEL